MSRAALEALAIIAYRQPVTRADIDYLRGVDSGGVVKSLLDKRLVRIVGKKDIPGRTVDLWHEPRIPGILRFAVFGGSAYP